MNSQITKKRERERAPNNRTTGFRISDEFWAVLQPLLLVHVNTYRFGGGRPRVPDRECAHAIFYVLRTGCQWQALDQTSYVHTPQPMIASKNRCKPESFSTSGKQDWSSLMSCVASR